MKKIIIGIAGLGIVILVHEFGHFIFAKLFNVVTPVFSIGFGPALISISIKNTLFQIALLPFGGYVELDPVSLNAQPYFAKLMIMLGGIIFNILFAYSILWIIKLQRKTYDTENGISTYSNLKKQLSHILETTHQKRNIIGPIGIINILGTSFMNNHYLFWFILAIISINIGLFNIIPLPFLDGGKILFYTIQAITKQQISETSFSYFSLLLLGLFILLFILISVSDIKQWRSTK